MNVRPWLCEGRYHALRTELEIAWAPILGPSALVAWRRANSLFRSGVNPLDADLLGAMLGLDGGGADRGNGTRGRHIGAALNRLDLFGRAFIDGDNVYVAVNGDFPGEKLRKRWPAELHAWAETIEGPPGVDLGVRVKPRPNPAQARPA